MSSEKEFTNILEWRSGYCNRGGRIITRVRPMVIEEKDYHSWTIEARRKEIYTHEKDKFIAHRFNGTRQGLFRGQDQISYEKD